MKNLSIFNAVVDKMICRNFGKNIPEEFANSGDKEALATSDYIHKLKSENIAVLSN
jgi:hypothetical protein